MGRGGWARPRSLGDDVVKMRRTKASATLRLLLHGLSHQPQYTLHEPDPALTALAAYLQDSHQQRSINTMITAETQEGDRGSKAAALAAYGPGKHAQEEL